MDAFDLYKPLRNHLRRHSLLQGLGVVRSYFQHLQFDQPFPRDIQIIPTLKFSRSPENRGVHEWELEILAKELILNSPDAGKTDLRQAEEFIGAINKLKALEEGIHKRFESLFRPNILIELYRIAHRQFPWQVRPNPVQLSRYFKIFGHPQMDELLQRHLGLSARTFYKIGLALAGSFLTNFGQEHPIASHLPGISDNDVELFLERFSSDLASMREAIRAAQSYDQDYAYTYNPLRARPLLWVSLNGKRVLTAPVPTYLYRRFTEGLYYELCDKPGFSKAFGESFQEYVGEVACAANERGRLSVTHEERYHVGKNAKDTIDWIITDSSGHLFVECKTKRLTIRAKIELASSDALDEELGKMASFIIQIYKTMLDAKSALYPNWKPDGRPIYPLLVTLEDWFLFGDPTKSTIDERVQQGLIDAGIDPAIRISHPYTICSAAEFEVIIQLLEKVGIGNGMPQRFVDDRGDWLASLALQHAFPNELKTIKHQLFPRELAEIEMRT